MADFIDVGYLKSQRNILISQIDLYKELKIDINKNPSENGKVMVLIGDGYFTEKTVSEADEFLDRRIHSLSDIVDRFNMSIKHESNESEKLKSSFVRDDYDNAVREMKSEEKLNEEGLPFMDIVEEMDDNGNIIGVTVNNKKHKDYTIMSLDHDNYSNSASKNIEEESKTLQSTIPGLEDEEFVDIQEELDEYGNVIGVKLGKVDEFEPFEDKPDNDNDDGGQIKELLEDLEVYGTPNGQSNTPKTNNLDISHVLDKIDELDLSGEDKFRLKSIVLDKEKAIDEPKISQVESYREDEEDEEEPQNFEEKLPQDHIIINKKDLLELEVLADDFNEGYEEEEEEEGLDDDYDFEFEEDGYDENEDDDDLDDEYESSFFGHSKANDMLWGQINKLRESKVKEKIPAKSNIVLEKSGAKQVKKSVTFNEELDIFEIERIKKEDYEQPKPISRFKQLKERHNETSNKAKPNNAEGSVSDIVERPVGDIVERPVGDIVERSVSDIMERPVGDIVERPVSDIMERPVGDIVERSRDNMELPNYTVTDNSNELARDIKSRQPRVSRFKKDKESVKIENPKSTKELVHNLTSTNIQVTDIVEQPMNEIFETSADVSVQNESERELLRMIQEYSQENDEIEGPVITNLSDIQKLNEMHDRLDVDSYEIPHDHDHEHDHDSHSPERVSNDIPITEKDTNTTGDLIEVMENDQVDFEVRSEYFRFKDQLKAKSSSDREIEPLVKQSRFKQRLHQ
ncbi:hypothetical protein CANTEDRAFT_134475 [Yamadazyma tenuis ATCC 10573]|uniref:DUF3835 domain-containing protein n=2 Tax=Candida tenuis TaxID=2315449 RepID=G3B3Z0_CANTC|nr:uncharacterized protein CANTEDRAFT_134475 [Yamadazyma tenuis ATCC 10573]EGV63895.1 hypothetical protein CANTEDRAFT_134475 [Yamadazyma tenuis ATCC 10573]